MSAQEAPIIRFDKVNKWYASNGYHVLRDINLDFAKGEKVVICGPSGSGKSTLIRCVNALEKYQEGQLTVRTALSSVTTSRASTAITDCP